MAAVTGAYDWHRSSPLRSSPETASSMYPDRPIRPLPRRSLRARLSPEQAETIVYPDHPPSTGPLFNYSYSSIENGDRIVRTGENDRHACLCGETHSEPESDEDEDERGAPIPSSPSYQYSVVMKPALGVGGGHPKAVSAASSVDGYDSFEHTNNKKKRKIPNMGSNGSHHTSLSADMAILGIAHNTGATDDGDGSSGRCYESAPSTPQHSTTTTGTGISGAGRGRFARSGSGRSERRVLGNSAHVVNAKGGNKRPPEQSGIISTAIANAQATPPPRGSENVSLLHQEAARNSANKTQFTFTCGSDSANKMVWPGQENGGYPQPPGAFPASNGAAAHHHHHHHHHHQPVRARPPVRPDAPMVSTQGTQTSPRINGTHAPAASRRAPPPQKAAHAQPPPQQQAPPPPKPKRSASKLYKHAANKRRIQQEYANFHNPPTNPWICEFCEFEDIFGYKPTALIRQYERKDRQERKKLAEKRRLLEKARMKGRKGKKPSKKAQNSASHVQQAQHVPPAGYDRRPDDGSLDAQDDEYYDDDDDDNHYDDLPPTPHCHHGCQHHPHPPPHKVPGLPPGDARLGAPPIANGA